VTVGGEQIFAVDVDTTALATRLNAQPTCA
jgi:hypothetical protein